MTMATAARALLLLRTVPSRPPQHVPHHHHHHPACTTRTLSYSRMLDLGGAPSSMNKKNTTRMDANKNCHVQAICFDFDVLTRSVDAASETKRGGEQISTSTTTEKPGKIEPDVSMVQQFADLMQVDLGGENKTAFRPLKEDDLSKLIGAAEPITKAKKEAPLQKDKNSNNALPGMDIRAKYAAKLSKKGVSGGIASVELAKHQVGDSLKGGDAAGLMAARKIATAEQPVGGQRWMAMTGTGSLLSYLTQRSMKIALLPHPVKEIDAEEGQRMEDFKKQLSSVVFDLLSKDGTLGANKSVGDTLDFLKLEPNLVLLVSDRDDYLKAANDSGMVTCRIQPKNSRRGNVSAHYTVEAVPEVKDVVNEINGISFNAVLQSR